jgi:hypothetical protein
MQSGADGSNPTFEKTSGMIHHIPWPFSKILDWLKTYFQSKQLNELIALQKQQQLRDTIPDLNVTATLIHQPLRPQWNSSVPIVQVILENYGGKTNITQGRVWLSLSDNPTYKNEKNLTNLEMPKGKKQELILNLKVTPHQQVIGGAAVLKLHYDLHFHGPNQQPETSNKTYRYSPQQDAFINE